MPEGDTLFRTARTLSAALAGRPVTAFSSSLPAVDGLARRHGLVGRRLDTVSSRGKHLLVHFEGGLVLHTHLGMHGSWRLQRRPAAAGPHARVVITTAEVTAVCVDAAVVELLTARQLAVHAQLRQLGPDVLAEGFDAVLARARLRSLGACEIGVALVDQRALAGIGNIYKSEALFACGLFPQRRVDELDDAAIERLIDVARRLMRDNLGTGPRRTSAGRLGSARYAVYGRARQPCPRCSTAIERLLQGDPPRSTYYCPRCQPARLAAR